jgi:hypothetical protein
VDFIGTCEISQGRPHSIVKTQPVELDSFLLLFIITCYFTSTLAKAIQLTSRDLSYLPDPGVNAFLGISYCIGGYFTVLISVL